MATRSRILLLYAIMAACWFGLLVLFPFAAKGQQPTLAPPHDAVASVSNLLGRGGPAGSGTLIEVPGGQPILLTADHIFHRTRPAGGNTEVYAGRQVGKIVVEFPSGHRTSGRLVDYSEPMDVALVSIEQAPPHVQPVKLVVLQPNDGPFTAIGYPAHEAGQRWRQGRFLRWRRGYEAILSTPMKSGYSGGPLINRFGEQVGVVTSTSQQTSTHTAGPDLVHFVERQCPND